MWRQRRANHQSGSRRSLTRNYLITLPEEQTGDLCVMLRHAYFTALHGETTKVRDTRGSSHHCRVMKRLPAETISWAVNTLEAAGCAFGDWRSEPSGRWNGSRCVSVDSAGCKVIIKRVGGSNTYCHFLHIVVSLGKTLNPNCLQLLIGSVFNGSSYPLVYECVCMREWEANVKFLRYREGPGERIMSAVSVIFNLHNSTIVHTCNTKILRLWLRWVRHQTDIIDIQTVFQFQWEIKITHLTAVGKNTNNGQMSIQSDQNQTCLNAHFFLIWSFSLKTSTHL